MYYGGSGLPYIILCHQQGSSRGEFRELAPKLLNLGYNCLAIDLRLGDDCNYVPNLTADMAKSKDLSVGLFDCTKDIRAAIRYVYEKSAQPVVLFGSGFSASLCLMESRQNAKVKAAIAFEPGEYFRPEHDVRESLKAFDKPVFIGFSPVIKPYINELLAYVPEELRTLSSSKASPGFQGARLLWNTNSENGDYWLDLLLFFSKIKSPVS